MFCFRSRWSPSLRCRVHSVSPVLRSRHLRLMFSPSATFRKMRSPQIIGGDPLHAGISTFQAMLVSVSHSVGRFVSVLTPVRAGPRQLGQFSPAPARVGTATMPPITRMASPKPRAVRQWLQPRRCGRLSVTRKSSAVGTTIVYQYGGRTP